MIEMFKHMIKMKVLLAALALIIGGLATAGEAWADCPAVCTQGSCYGSCSGCSWCSNNSQTNAKSGENQPPSNIARPSDTDYVDKTTDMMNQVKENVAGGHNWSGYAGQSVNNKESNTETQSQGSATSGNVAKYVGASDLGMDYGMRDCTAGNIFQQLGCRAGVVGRGLQSVGYLIAGFGLLTFSLAAVFGKVKWPVFVTIMFSVFLLSMTIYVINTFTKSGNANWIAFEQIKSTGMGNSIAVPPTDSGSTNIPKGEQSPGA